MRYKYGIITILLAAFSTLSQAQDFIPLWPAGKMPDSKGMQLKDSIYNERIFQVGIPGMYTFFSSRQENKGAAVIICPGGGYHHLSYMISGWQLAKWFNVMGINAFVLNYRLPLSPDLKDPSIGPLQDAQRAMRLVRAHAAEWGIDPQRVGIMGVSAGGHLAACLGTLPEDVAAIGDSLDRYSFWPDFTILVSPVISMGKWAHKGSRENLLGKNPSEEQVRHFSPELQVKDTTPPCFIADAFNDRSVDPHNSLLFYEALLNKKIVTSLHVFPQGGHAIALRNNPGSTQLWTALCEAWLEEMKIIPDVKK